MSPKVPTPIVDKNGKNTTVHKNTEVNRATRNVPTPSSSVPEPQLNSRGIVVEDGILNIRKNAELISSEGLNAYSEDDILLGTYMIYCALHETVHQSGTCDAQLYYKVPIGMAVEEYDFVSSEEVPTNKEIISTAIEDVEKLGLKLSDTRIVPLVAF